MRVVYTTSAGKHGIGEEDATWAIEHAVLVKLSFQRSRLPDLPDPTLFVGPARDGRLIEVMAVHLDNATVIFHAMRARKMFLNLISRHAKGEGR